MNVPLIALLIFALAQTSGDTTALVQAAKESKAKRKTSGTRKVITNADLAKSKGKVIQRKPEDLKPLPPVESLVEKHEADRKAKALYDEKMRVLEETIGALEKEVAAIERAYFEAHDLDYRDKEIVAKFTEVKAKLDAATAERDALLASVGQER
jgi:hypothetical protein